MHRILVVDNDETLCRGLCRFMESLVSARSGVRVESAHSAEEARLLIEGNPKDVWFLLLDEEMPAHEGDLVKSGLELIRHLRSETSIDTTIVMMGSRVTQDEARAVGVVWLPKPCNMQRLRAHVCLWLSPLSMMIS